MEHTGVEAVTIPKAFGTLYRAELISHSIYFRLFLLFNCNSLEAACDFVSKGSVYFITQSFAFLVALLPELL